MNNTEYLGYTFCALVLFGFVNKVLSMDKDSQKATEKRVLLNSKNKKAEVNSKNDEAEKEWVLISSSEGTESYNDEIGTESYNDEMVNTKAINKYYKEHYQNSEGKPHSEGDFGFAYSRDFVSPHDIGSVSTAPLDSKVYDVPVVGRGFSSVKKAKEYLKRFLEEFNCTENKEEFILLGSGSIEMKTPLVSIMQEKPRHK